MTSLFSSFDMFIFFNSAMVLLLSSLAVSSAISKVKILGSIQSIISQDMLSKFFYTLKPKNFNKTSNILILSVLTSILFMNFFSVFSFNFPLASQFGMVLGMGAALWVSFLTLSMSKNFEGSISHFIPEGTPLPLTVFLFVIELISNLIRPLTLTVRLVANILAGHLLLILLSNLVFSVNFMFLGYIFLNAVELAVAMIQAYIFVTMITLYFSEVH